jgi:hypothetical protein
VRELSILARGFKGEYKGIGYKGSMRKKDEKERAKSSTGRALKVHS